MVLLLADYEASRTVELQVHEDDPASIVAARFRRSGYPALGGIQCELCKDVLVLSGSVPTYHLKQLAQVLALHTPGVRQVENCVRVTYEIQSGKTNTQLPSSLRLSRPNRCR